MLDRFILSFLLLSSSLISAQIDNEIDFRINNRIYLFGESHIENNSEHKLELIKEIGCKHLVLEIPKSYGVKLNNWIKEGGDEKVLNSIPVTNKRDFKRLMRGIKMLGTGFNIKLSFCDVERVYRSYPMEALIRFTEDFGSLKKTQLWTLLNKFKFNTEYKISFSYISEELKINKKLYKDILGDLFQELEDILKSSLISLKYRKNSLTDLRFMADREMFMARSISKELATDSPLYVFLGQAHVNKLENEYWNGQKTVVTILSKEYNLDVFSTKVFYRKKKRIKKRDLEYSVVEDYWEKNFRKYEEIDGVIFLDLDLKGSDCNILIDCKYTFR